MQTRNAVMLVLTVAGCADSAVAKRLPGVALDETSRAAIANANPTPQCGYDYYHEDGPDTPPSKRHLVTTFVYDSAGLITADYDVDDTGVRVYNETIAYNAMGQPVQRTVTSLVGHTREFYNMYDSFGRVVRRSQDGNGDGVEDGFTIYSYGQDNLRLSAHTESGDLIIDDAYGYDEMGRIATVDNTSTEDNLNFSLVYTYDDRAHTVNGIGTTAAGHYYTIVTTYNTDNLVVSDESVHLDPSSGAVMWTGMTTNTYEGKDMITARSVEHFTSSSGSPGREINDRYEYHYGDCQ
jgi:hypothetical protein